MQLDETIKCVQDGGCLTVVHLLSMNVFHRFDGYKNRVAEVPQRIEDRGSKGAKGQLPAEILDADGDGNLRKLKNW